VSRRVSAFSSSAVLTRGNQGLQGLQGYGQQTPQQGWAGPRATSDYDPTAPTMDAFQYQQQQQQQQQYAYQYNQAPPQQQQAPYSAPQVGPPPKSVKREEDERGWETNGPQVARSSPTPSHPPLFSPICAHKCSGHAKCSQEDRNAWVKLTDPLQPSLIALPSLTHPLTLLPPTPLGARGARGQQYR
jgi:hypothetical protein